MKWTSTEIAILGMSVTIVVAVLSALAAYMASKRERRRLLYGDAVQAIVAWKELLYRVRRRSGEEDRELVGSFHVLQDKLTYFEAWIGSESKFMSRSYCRLVRAVKAATEPLIQSAWKGAIRPVPGDALPEDEHPDLQAPVDAFLDDVRSHLSPFPWRKIAVAWRNREQES